VARNPVYIPHRSLKDPREIQVLDPASGSGHFLLYCFDLLLTIYEEAWDDCPDLLRDIRTSTPAKADFMKQVPAMILRYNLHGIDIDARAAQIAELALWMRAQRAYATMNLRPTDRPPILRTNIVVAEPMPGDRAMLAEFLWDVDERLRPLVETIWEQMQLAGETGSLLKIEETIKSALDEARTESMVDVPPRQVTLFNPNQAPVQKVFTFASVEERAFWDQAEEHLLKTLENYARHASGAAGMRRRLFAENAAQGFAFIDLFRKQFDVMLMNPPFGLPSKSGKAYIEHNYPNSKRDLYSAFIDRALQLSFIDGLVGALTSRTGFFLNSFESWRNEVILKHTNITVFADLGDGVLDKALVETAAYCIQNKPANENASSIFIRLLDISDNKKEKELVRVISIDSNDEEKKFILKLSSLRAVPGSPFAYWVPSTLRNLFSYLDPVESNEREARVGVQTSDDFRFVRLWSEVPLNSLLKPSYKENEDPKKIQEHCIDSTRTYAVWVSFAKGGGFRQYSSNQHLVINWYQNGKELKVYNANLYGSVSRNVRSESHYFRPGITWSYLPLKRGSFRILPGGSIFSVGGPALFSNQESLLTILSVLNSDAFFALMRFFMPRGTGISQATLKFEVGYVQKVPFPNLSKNQIVMLSDLSIRIHDASRALDIYDELSPQFTIPLIIVDNHNIGLRESSFKSNQMVKLLNDRKLSLQEQIDRVVFEAYGLSTSLWCKTLYNQVKPT